MAHSFDALDAPLPPSRLPASCDWGCPNCELMCGILARTVRDTGADLARAIGELPAEPTVDQVHEVERLRAIDASARRQFDRKRGLPVDDGRGCAVTLTGGRSLH